MTHPTVDIERVFPSPAIGLRHLQALVAVAGAGSVARAADGLYRASSAVTRLILELETALRTSLFERRARGMLINSAGQLVLRRAQRIDTELDHARSHLVSRCGVQAAADARTLFASVRSGRRLAVLANLSDTRNMAAVAARFGLTPPAVSLALKDLEAGLDVALYLRSARGLALTAAGEIVALHFKRILSELRHIVPDLAASAGRLEGTVQIGALPLGRTRIVPTAIAALLARHPGLRVSTVETPYDALALALRSGDIDFMFGALRHAADVPDLDQTPLFVDRLAVVARAGHPLASARNIGPATLVRAQWVLSHRGSRSRELLDRYASTALGGPLAPAVETGDLALLRGLLLESDMMTAISPLQLDYEIADGSLAVLDVRLEGTERPIGIVLRQGALPSPGARALMDELTRTVSRRVPPPA